MKRSTASATNTAKTEAPDGAPVSGGGGRASSYARRPAERPRGWFRGRRKRRSSSLTLRILAVNMVAPLVLVVGVLYMDQYRTSLIRAELETLAMQAQLFAGAIAEGAVKPVEQGKPFLFARPEEIEVLIPELSRRMVRRLGEMSENRTRVFNRTGELIGDSQYLLGAARGVMGPPAPAAVPQHNRPFSNFLARIMGGLVDMLPTRTTLPPYPHTASQHIGYYPDATNALQGQVSATAWRNHDGRVLMTAASPVRKNQQTMGVVMLTREGHAIEAAMVQVRTDVLTAFIAAFALTIFLSIYLAGIIGRPLKRLARAAESIRTGKSRQVTIPDLSHRHDEIGELSLSLRDMTHALWDRMDMIERFAADVAHEIKNPLTSLRSAVETAARVKKPADRDKLMDIILHDVQRLDRLISDISNASRLDAELSREEMGIVDLGALLESLADMHRAPLARTGGTDADDSKIVIRMPSDRHIFVAGNETRLAQVFENLVTNALSFSPPDAPVIVRVTVVRGKVHVMVEDSGPGIPEAKLDTIFERFYTERPKHESYGSHSGLGLSIARQIVTAHGGEIYAENMQGDDGRIAGARFTVILEAA